MRWPSLALSLTLPLFSSCKPAAVSEPPHAPKITQTVAEIKDPLDALSTDELRATLDVAKKTPEWTKATVVISAAVNEPDKQLVLTGDETKVPREALVISYEPARNETAELVIDVAKKNLLSRKVIPNVQPLETEVDIDAATALTKADPRWQEAMKKRGITNWDEVYLDVWSPGGVNLPKTDHRLMRVLSDYKGKSKNPYGPPIEGVLVTVDLTAKAVHSVTDTGVVPLSPKTTDIYDPQRTTNDPEVNEEPAHPDYQISGSTIKWGPWTFHYAMHPRDGLIISKVHFHDASGDRSVLYRAAISEMAIPYGVPDPNWFWRSAFDEGEYGLGRCAVELQRGRTAPDNATLLGSPTADDAGNEISIPKTVFLAERENGILWSHSDIDAGTVARRNHELVIGFIAEVGNYDYCYQWIFRRDGSIKFQVELTGIMLTKGVDQKACLFCQPNGGNPQKDERFGTIVAENVLAALHQHFINVRLDFDIEGTRNAVREMEVVPVPSGAENPVGNAFQITSHPIATESDAARQVNAATSRVWEIYNPNRKTALGHYPGYMLHPEGNAVALLSKDSEVRQRAGFLDAAFFVTAYDPSEMHAAGDYPCQDGPIRNLKMWQKRNAPLDNQDVVVWYTLGITHLPRPEEYPVMPAAHASFTLEPSGFFDENPALK